MPERGTPVAQVIDQFVEATLEEKGISAAPVAADEALVRRVTLDLNGRIPTVAEAQAYLASQDDDRWEQLVDRLLADAAFDRYQAHEWNHLLMDGQEGDFKSYLTQAMEQGYSWDRIFRDAIAGVADSEELKGTELFVRNRLWDHDKLTNDVSVRFFGVNISCAQCHDHPYIEDWTQETYYGMASFFNRTFENGGFLAERDYGLVSYQTTRGEDRQAALRFLGGAPIEEPPNVEPSDEEKRSERDLYKKLKDEKKAPPLPEYSRRMQMIPAVLEDAEAQGYLARSIVNRVWNQYFGRGLVMPLDQMHGLNLPSHPELLEWLAQDLIARDFDVVPLIRGIVMSQTYRRDSRWEEGERPAPELFAVAQPRALSPRQYGVSLKLASQDPSFFAADVEAKELTRRLDLMEQQGARLVEWFGRPGEGFAVTVDEALYFSNGQDARNHFLNGGLVRALEKVQTPREQVAIAYGAILNRAPDAEESRILTEYLESRADQPDQALRQVVWAMFSGAEARFNH